jgi:nucleotide-binding universal stress UspA family protein
MKVLLPIDGSDCSNETLAWAAETFSKRDTAYYLLYVIPVLPDLNTVEYDIVEATAMLRRAKTFLEKLGCRVDAADYALGDVVDQICRYADKVPVDQLLIGSHGRTGLSKLLMGSTSIQVMERSPRSVMVHRNITRAVARPG